METRHSTFERGKGSPSGTDAFPVERSPFSPSAATPHAAASSAADNIESPQLLVVDERPLSAEDCAIGEVIAGKYLIEGVIGRGSMGVVVRATHLGFDELVALKFIRPEMRELDGIVSRFAREAKASVRIRNEHAVNVLDVGVAEPIGPFFVMEYLEGINLEELVDSQGPFDAPTAVRYVLEACEALAAAHAQGIIHRDIKPQNMFLAWQGRLEVIKLLDFGISKAALSGQIFGDDLSIREKDWVMGTPLYMSPEQLRHAPDVDERTDIWSLGAVLYELLFGQPLFSGDTQTAVYRQVVEVSERPVRVPVEGVPDGLWDVIERCLSPDKEHRYAGVADLGQALLPFAPPGACLHVERARALLGLRPLDFFGLDSDVEDIDVEPLEEGDAHTPTGALGQRALAGSGDAAAPAGPRGPYWVELAVPALACAVAFIGLHQWQLSRDAADLRTEAVQTEALRARLDCPAPRQAAPAVAEPAATTRAPSNPAPEPNAPVGEPAFDPSSVEVTAGVDESDDVHVGPGGVGTNAAPAPAPTGGAPAADTAAPPGERAPLTVVAGPAASPTGRPRPSDGVRSVAARPTLGIGSPASVSSGVSQAVSSGVTSSTAVAGAAPLRDPALPLDPSAAPAAAAPAAVSADARAAAARRNLKPKPKTDPKLEFRLIDEQPPSGFGLVPNAQQRAAVPSP